MSREAELLIIKIEQAIYGENKKLTDEQIAELNIPTVNDVDEANGNFVSFVNERLFESKEDYEIKFKWISDSEWFKLIDALYAEANELMEVVLKMYRELEANKFDQEDMALQLVKRKVIHLVDRYRIEGLLIPVNHQEEKTQFWSNVHLVGRERLHSYWEEGFNKEYFETIINELKEFLKENGKQE